jgi:hypothetical protein
MHPSRIHLPIRVSASRFFLYGTLAFALLLLFSGVASAQTPDTYRVTYFDNNFVPGAPVAFVHILNPGVSGAPTATLCASIYVWRFDQELSECCSCKITPNGLLTIPVPALTNNPGDHPGFPFSGSIAIISYSNCDPTNPTPTADLRAWATHVNLNTSTAAATYDVTETEALDTPLSAGELAEVQLRCGVIRVNGSGAGRCDRACTSTAP